MLFANENGCSYSCYSFNACSLVNKRKKERKALLWNVEGLKHVLSVLPTSVFDEYDLLLFCETFSIASSNNFIRGFYSFDCFAQKKARGRPAGGVSIFVSPSLTPAFTTFCENNVIAVCLSDGTAIILAYMRPKQEVTEILELLLAALDSLPDAKCTLIAGDFNCRIDESPPKAKTQALLDALNSRNFSLLNDASIKTYLAPNGSSTVDLAFVDAYNRFSSSLTPVSCIQFSGVRKHLPLQLLFSSFHSKDVVTRPKGFLRRMNLNLFENSQELQSAYQEILQGRHEFAYTNVLLAIEKSCCASPVRKRYAKEWFDQELYVLRAQVEQSRQLASLRSEQLPLYSRLRKSYKYLISEKKKAFLLRHEQKLIAEAEYAPYVYVRETPVFRPSSIPLDTWYSHFSSLLSCAVSSATGHYSLNQSIVPPPDSYSLSSPHCPFTGTEILAAINSCKNRKAAGPDRLTYEHLKLTQDHLCLLWVQLFNECLEKGCFPTQWTNSIIQVLFKNKGDPMDPNNYRGIAFLSVTFKVLTKIVASRLDRHLHSAIPEEQHGFRKGKSTSTAISSLLRYIREKLQAGSPVYAIFVDFSKAIAFVVLL